MLFTCYYFLYKKIIRQVRYSYIVAISYTKTSQLNYAYRKRTVITPLQFSSLYKSYKTAVSLENQNSL